MYRVKMMLRRLLKFIYLNLSLLLFYFILWILSTFAEMGDGEKKRLAKWYFGGLGSAGAACCTHPLDLIKVHLQTAQGGNMGAAGQAVHIVRSGENDYINSKENQKEEETGCRTKLHNSIRNSKQKK